MPTKVRFMIVPPGGGEVDYNFFAELDALPRAGDYVQLFSEQAARDAREHGGGSDEFGLVYLIVRRVWWAFKSRDDDAGHADLQDGEVGIEVEYAIGPMTSKKEAKSLESQGAKTWEATAY